VFVLSRCWRRGEEKQRAVTNGLPISFLQRGVEGSVPNKMIAGEDFNVFRTGLTRKKRGGAFLSEGGVLFFKPFVLQKRNRKARIERKKRKKRKTPCHPLPDGL